MLRLLRCKRECGSKVLLARKTSIAALSRRKSDQRISRPTDCQRNTQASVALPRLGLLALRRVIISAGGEPRTIHKSPSSLLSMALAEVHSTTATPSASDMARWVTHSCVIPRAYLKLAPVTAEAKVRENNELRHHQRIVMNMMEAGARTEKQVLWSADHTLDHRQ